MYRSFLSVNDIIIRCRQTAVLVNKWGGESTRNKHRTNKYHNCVQKWMLSSTCELLDRDMPGTIENLGSTARDFCMLERNVLAYLRLGELYVIL
jgi:hypothetical protein